MDGNVRAKRIARELGFHLKMVQQTFVVPSDPGAAGGWDKARDDLVEWLEFADDFLRARKLRATLTDVLFLPRDLPFLLSAGADLAGFAVTYAFEVSKDDQIGRVKQAFSELAEVLSGEKFGGRIYLVKNVCAKKETLRRMYGENAAAFLRLKGELDPQGILRNEFLEKTFGAPTPA
jgi:decaprenylphospho-beta-D-ribofuranose 2-oxidase